ncbi:hypothetical protein PQR39_35635 [Paraburkholderia sediminicola]|uniref:hypothetical protein n=1 Tax=Paraburkholderia sediminicola TaxID=458836 RepID=UPI0038B81D86
MSKRYGRNQKRAHRSRIAELENELAKTREHAALLDSDCREYSREIECAKRIVGEYCVAFNPHGRTMPIGEAQFVEVMQYERDFNPGVTRYWDFNPNEMLAPISVSRIRLPILCVLANREQIRGSRHLSVVYDGKAWGYAIDPMAWRMSRYPIDLCRNIAERLTHMIYEEMSKDTTVRAELRRTHTRDEPDPRVTFPNFNFGMPELPDFLR